jgi:hypothetical protein
MSDYKYEINFYMPAVMKMESPKGWKGDIFPLTWSEAKREARKISLQFDEGQGDFWVCRREKRMVYSRSGDKWYLIEGYVYLSYSKLITDFLQDMTEDDWEIDDDD